ncbi:MAG: preprotein translocase subunit SecE [Bacteroidota bacterium]|nr:preprotein translocase subunit SecE [Bacteroidota bacterium]
MEKIKNLWNSSVDELLNKVTWPTWDQLRESAIIVLIASIVFSILIWLLDYALGFGLDFLYGVTK